MEDFQVLRHELYAIWFGSASDGLLLRSEAQSRGTAQGVASCGLAVKVEKVRGLQFGRQGPTQRKWNLMLAHARCFRSRLSWLQTWLPRPGIGSAACPGILDCAAYSTCAGILPPSGADPLQASSRAGLRPHPPCLWGPEAPAAQLPVLASGAAEPIRKPPERQSSTLQEIRSMWLYLSHFVQIICRNGVDFRVMRAPPVLGLVQQPVHRLVIAEVSRQSGVGAITVNPEERCRVPRGCSAANELGCAGVFWRRRTVAICSMVGDRKTSARDSLWPDCFSRQKIRRTASNEWPPRSKKLSLIRLRPIQQGFPNRRYLPLQYVPWSLILPLGRPQRCSEPRQGRSIYFTIGG